MAFLVPRFRELANTFIDRRKNYGKFAQAISACSSFFYAINTMEMMGIGFIFTLLFKIPFWLGVLIAAVIVVTYTYTGGLWAVAVTDMFQFTIMALSLGIALLICWTDLGGYNGIYSGLAAY